MKQIYLVGTTGFERAGFELFAITLSTATVEELLALIGEAKRLSRLDPGFSFIVLKNNAGAWLSKETVSEKALERRTPMNAMPN